MGFQALTRRIDPSHSVTVTPCYRAWSFDGVTDNVTVFRHLPAPFSGVTQTTVHVIRRCTQRLGSFLEPDQFRRFELGTPDTNQGSQ